MSSQRGNVKKSGPPKHQNRMAYRNNMHDKTKKIQMLNQLEIVGCCARCKDIIEWKIKYKKYKPLTQAKTCTKCHQKTIKRAYYIICEPCSERLEVCSKCGDKTARANLPSSSTNGEEIKTPEPKILPDYQTDQMLTIQAGGSGISDDQSGTGGSSIDSTGNVGDDSMSDLEQELSTVSHELPSPGLATEEERRSKENTQKLSQLDFSEKKTSAD